MTTPAYLPPLPPVSRGFEQSRPFTSAVPDDPPTMRVAVFGPPLTSAAPVATPPPSESSF